MKRVSKALLKGKIFSSEIDNWTVTWESDGCHRHWCLQEKQGQEKTPQILVVMLNPGSLQGSGENLRKDATLRILRNVFSSTKYGCLVANLFDLAGQPNAFFGKWKLGDKSSQLVYDELFSAFHINGVIFAYGDYENSAKKEFQSGLQNRILLVREKLSQQRISGIDSPQNSSGTPMHPRGWQIRKKLDRVKKAIISHRS
jgi:hypothetical protein